MPPSIESTVRSGCATRRRLEDLSEVSDVELFHFSPDGRTLAVSDAGGRVHLLDSVTRKEVWALPHERRVTGLSYSPDGKLLVTGDVQGYITLWEPATQTKLREVSGAPNTVKTVAFSPDGQASRPVFYEEDAVKLWDRV